MWVSVFKNCMYSVGENNSKISSENVSSLNLRIVFNRDAENVWTRKRGSGGNFGWSG